MAISAVSDFPFERFLELSNDLLFVLDDAGRFARVTPAASEILGGSSRPLEGRAFVDVLHPDDITAARAALAPLVASPRAAGSARFEARLLEGADRGARKLAFTLHAAADDAAIYGVGREVAPASAAEDRRRRSAELLALTQATAKVGGWDYDCRTQELYWTEETYRIHEVPPDFRPRVETALDFYAPEYIQAITEAFGRCVAHGEPYSLDLQVITATGRRIWVRSAGNAILEQGAVVRVCGSFQDIGELKQRELELAEQLTIIEQQRAAMQAMSAPIIQVWDGVIALPVVGRLDAARAADITERLLAQVVQSRASQVILDLTGVETVDDATADHLLRIIRAIQLLGASSIVTGICPTVAQTLVSLGGSLEGVKTLSSLRDAIKASRQATSRDSTRRFTASARR